MHILVVNWQDRTHPLSGGAEIHLHEIFGRIAAAGHKVTLLCCAHTGAPAHEVLDGIDIVRAGRRSSFNYTVALWWKRHGAALNPDIVVDDINKIPFLTPRFVKRPILAVIHHLFGKTIYSEAGLVAGLYVRAFERRIATVYRNTPLCVVSESTRQECESLGFRSDAITVIHNAIDHRHFPMSITKKADVPTVVFVGRLKKYKSVDHVLRAAAVVHKVLPNIRIEILGTGDQLEALRILAGQLGLTDNVTFHGFVTEAEKTTWLSCAHVVVNSSVKEGWGISNIEANACGTPVISANVPGLRDSVRDGTSGLLYEYGDVGTLAQLMQRLLVDTHERERLSEGALRWASTFTWERSAREMVDLCARVIEQWKR